jgi:hypothetical protein
MHYIFWVDASIYPGLERHDGVRAVSAKALHPFFSLIALVAISGWTVQKLTERKLSLLHRIVLLMISSLYSQFENSTDER